jgi:hypothetical protein
MQKDLDQLQADLRKAFDEMPAEWRDVPIRELRMVIPDISPRNTHFLELYDPMKSIYDIHNIGSGIHAHGIEIELDSSASSIHVRRLSKEELDRIEYDSVHKQDVHRYLYKTITESKCIENFLRTAAVKDLEALFVLIRDIDNTSITKEHLHREIEAILDIVDKERAEKFLKIDRPYILYKGYNTEGPCIGHVTLHVKEKDIKHMAEILSPYIQASEAPGEIGITNLPSVEASIMDEELNLPVKASLTYAMVNRYKFQLHWKYDDETYIVASFPFKPNEG